MHEIHGGCCLFPQPCYDEGDLEGAQPSAGSCFMHAIADCRCFGGDSHRVCCGTRDIEVSTVPESVAVPVPQRPQRVSDSAGGVTRQQPMPCTSRRVSVSGVRSWCKTPSDSDNQRRCWTELANNEYLNWVFNRAPCARPAHWRPTA